MQHHAANQFSHRMLFGSCQPIHRCPSSSRLHGSSATRSAVARSSAQNWDQRACRCRSWSAEQQQYLQAGHPASAMASQAPAHQPIAVATSTISTSSAPAETSADANSHGAAATRTTARPVLLPRRVVLHASLGSAAATTLSLVGLPGPLGLHLAAASESSPLSGSGVAAGAAAPSASASSPTAAVPPAAATKRPVRPSMPRVPRVPRVKLPGGLSVSKVIKGCWQLDGTHRGDPRSDRTTGADAVADFERFFAAGITTIDTADIYGPSESLVGQYLRLNPELRTQVQILTKVTVMEEDMARLSKDMLNYRLRLSMRRLGVDYVDLVQLHWEDFGVRGYLDAARWLADMQADGLIGHVGLTNFDTQHLIEVLDAGVKVVSNQVQYSVVDRRPELYLTGLCERKGIAILPYGVLAGGFLSDRYLDMPARDAKLDTLSKAKYGTQLKEQGGWAYMQEVLQALKGVATKHSVSISAVALRWVLEQPTVYAAVVGARNARHLNDTRQALSQQWQLDEEDMLAIEAAYEGATAQPTSDCFVWERGGPW